MRIYILPLLFVLCSIPPSAVAQLSVLDQNQHSVKQETQDTKDLDPILELGPDISICETNAPIIIDDGNEFTDYAWNTSETTQSIRLAQAQNIEGRYIEIDNLSDFFIKNETDIEITKFYIKNFDENDSSKPIHIGVNKLNNVIKFGIASSSEKNYQQRRCFIQMEKYNFQETFYNVLNAMGIITVIVDGEIMSTTEFMILIKS